MKETPVWLETSHGAEYYPSYVALAKAIGASADRIAASFSVAKKKPGYPAVWKEYRFWRHDPAYRGAYTLKEKPHKPGEPLLVGNPTHHIGAWR